MKTRYASLGVGSGRVARFFILVPASDAKELHMKGSLRVAQFIARHKSFVADFNVPKAGTPIGVNLALDFQSRNRKLTLTSATRHLSVPVNRLTSLLEIHLTAMEQSRD